MNVSRVFLPVVFLAVTSNALASTTWYVNGKKGSDANDCMSASTACKTIRHAIALSSSGDTVMVAAADYQENLTIGVSLNLVGAGAKVTIIDGGRNGTVVKIPNFGTTVALSKLTVRNGESQSGAGINNNGVLTISSSTITSNSATTNCVTEGHCLGGGLYNGGSLTITNSTITGNVAGNVGSPNYGEGGGIYSLYGVLTIKNSTISSNTADGGGGIQAILGTMDIDNSTINSNNSGAAGGGAGIDNEATATINNSTITGNSEGGVGSGINNGGTLIVSSSTITKNTASRGGGGLRNWDGTTTLQNTIVSDNSVGGNCNGPIASNGYNLSSDDSCAFNGTGDLNNTKPELRHLRNNGGPTRTQALRPGSPAIDSGNPSGCTDGNGQLLQTDQRGDPRPDKQSGRCDMGAYEYQK